MTSMPSSSSSARSVTAARSGGPIRPTSGALAAATAALGPVEVVRDLTWELQLSAVLDVVDADGTHWVVKAHRDRGHYEAERDAYRAWVPSLGDRSPQLRAADDVRGAM